MENIWLLELALEVCKKIWLHAENMAACINKSSQILFAILLSIGIDSNDI